MLRVPRKVSVGVAVVLEWTMLFAFINARSVVGVVAWVLYLHFSATRAVLADVWAEDEGGDGNDP